MPKCVYSYRYFIALLRHFIRVFIYLYIYHIPPLTLKILSSAEQPRTHEIRACYTNPGINLGQKA